MDGFIFDRDPGQVGTWQWCEKANSWKDNCCSDQTMHEHEEQHEPKMMLQFFPSLLRNDKERKHLNQNSAKSGKYLERATTITTNQKDERNSSTITLEDITRTALRLSIGEHNFNENEVMRFEGIERNTTLNELLARLLQYFNCFLQEAAMTKAITRDEREASKNVLMALESIRSQLVPYRVLLGQSYAKLIMGIGVKGHHSDGGRSRISKSCIDRNFFLLLNSFCVKVVWITFSSRQAVTISREFERLCGADLIKDKPKPINNKAKDTCKLQESSIKWERTSMQRLMRMKSPVVNDVLTNLLEEESLNDASKTGLRFGIIGSPSNQFNPENLRPLLEDEDAD